MPELTIEMVPQPLWGISLANLMPKEKWDVLRKSVYREHDYHCGVCRASNTTMYCHEIWQYDDITHVQTLTGFVALCQMCHHVKHLGLAGVLASEGKLDFQQVILHYCQVNDCEGTQFFMDRANAECEWRERSEHEWSSNLGGYSHLLPDFQARVEAKKNRQSIVHQTLDM
jgi:hypothetical protein